MDEKISVIIPIYNVETYLTKCIDSVLNQTYQNLEIILVNDGSTDGCKRICDEYGRKYQKKIKVIHKKNGGLSSARNAGLDVAEGKLVAFVDSDDYIEPGMLEQLYKALIAYEADMSLCNLKVVFASQFKDKKHRELTVKWECMEQCNYWEKIFEPDYARFVVAWNKLYRKKIWEKLRYPNGKINEDEFVLHEIVSQCDKIVYSSYVGYNYVQRNGSIMSQKKQKPNFDLFDAWIERIAYFDSIERKELCRKNLVLYVEALVYIYNLCRTKEEKEKFQQYYDTYQTLYRKHRDGTFVSLKEKILKTGIEIAPGMINTAMRGYRFMWKEVHKWKDRIE